MDHHWGKKQLWQPSFRRGGGEILAPHPLTEPLVSPSLPHCCTPLLPHCCTPSSLTAVPPLLPHCCTPLLPPPSLLYPLLPPPSLLYPPSSLLPHCCTPSSLTAVPPLLPPPSLLYPATNCMQVSSVFGDPGLPRGPRAAGREGPSVPLPGGHLCCLDHVRCQVQVSRVTRYITPGLLVSASVLHFHPS